jgi:dolichyl-phosphate beta-glucosyltransferase
MRHVRLVFPCYNEEKRLDRARFLAMAQQGMPMLLVDDGSTDGTRALLHAIADGARVAGRAQKTAQGTNVDVDVLALDRNGGKAEAVRQGMLRAIEAGATIVAYADSDLATPPEEIIRLVEIAEESDAQVVMGSRVARAGAQIERSVKRHVLGRVWASAASLILRARFYDTQCGAKVFKVTPTLRAVLSRPFISRWGFDVEFIARLLAGEGDAPPLREEDFLEVPLRRWTDVKGSKLGFAAMARAAIDLGRIELESRKRRQR